MRSVALIGTLIVAAVGWAYAAEDAVYSFTLPSGVEIQIVEAPFDPRAHRLAGCTGGADGCLIDGRIPFGSDNDRPKTYVKSITASFKGKSHKLDSSQMYNAWNGRPLEVKGSRFFGGRCQDKNNCSLRGLFSDGAGTFAAEWQVSSGISQRTILTWSNDVVNQFAKHIDPPVYH